MGKHQQKQQQKACFPYWFTISQDSPYSRTTEDILTAEKYIKLSGGAKNLYLSVMTYQQNPEQWKMLNRYIETFPEMAQAQFSPRHQFFVFPLSVAIRYGIGDNVYRYFAELEEAGFIQCVVHNGKRKKPNIYKFVDEWKPKEFQNAEIEKRANPRPEIPRLSI